MLKFCTCSLLTNVYKRVRRIFILFRMCVIYQNKKIPGFYTLTDTSFINNSSSTQNKKNNSSHPFLDILKTGTCAKFQHKILNFTAVEARQSFQFFRQTTWFLANARALSKFKYWILHHLLSIIKLQNN